MDNSRYIAIAAVTIDGRIALDAAHQSDWTSPEDKSFMRNLLDECDAIIVGNNTYKIANVPLSARNCIVLTRTVEACVQKNDLCLCCNATAVDMHRVIASRNYRRVAVLGGTQTYTYCLEQNMIDELFLTIEPVVFSAGLPLFQSGRLNRKEFSLDSVQQLNVKGSVLLHYVARYD